MSANQIDYQQLARDASREIVRRVLAQTAAEGLPGDHHFYLTFDTTHPGVEISPQAQDLYPDEMTIVIQHQFWDLVVEEESFAVTLRFEGAKQRVRVPFEALTTFVDPVAEFGLNLSSVHEPEGDEENLDPEKLAAETGESDDEPQPDPHMGGDVVSIDRFRKKT